MGIRRSSIFLKFFNFSAALVTVATWITSCCLKKSDIFRALWISLSPLRYDFCVETHTLHQCFSGIRSWEAALAGEDRLQKVPPFTAESSNTQAPSQYLLCAAPAPVEPLQFKHSREAVCAHVNGVQVSLKHTSSRHKIPLICPNSQRGCESL